MNDAKPQTRRVLDACRPDIKREPHPLAGPRCSVPRRSGPNPAGASPAKRWP